MGIALDTNIFVYAYERSDELGERAKILLKKIIKPDHKVFVSVLVLEEFLVKIYKKGLQKELNQYESFLTGGGIFTIVDVNRQIARSAAKLRAEYPSLRVPDALHLASAIEAGAKVFFTTDKRLPRKIGKLTVRSLS
ncbi:PIN domain-containing protein [Candidatus Microgenomates bacterium]|nr:PIN domain-containing protein [Candidatus Microgenomates bacterium]